MKKNKFSIKKIRLWIIVISVITTSLISFSFVDNDFEIAKNLDIFATLYRELNNNYVDDIKPGELIKTGIDAMLESLDPYTTFISESELEDYKLMTTGQYGGIGAMIHQKDDVCLQSQA